ncbi:neurofilament medium polypeptide-like [Coffea eugenioides]|uniref:neurofilament medium polypeptide-like n=1 Tax=Coffea eugenioides TaxID=49369 RepID=UPI000F608624|nr:neurofilament medium polypeptide-like [Coffea eugenioides]
MGCCLSTQKKPSKDGDKCGGASPPKPLRSPPRAEEETVKEVLVLSETPIPKPSVPDVVDKKNDRCKPPENQELEIQIQSTAEIKPAKESTVVIKPAEDIISEASEQSELCSFTGSFSTTTTATAMDKRDDGEEVNQKSPVRVRRKRTNAGDIAGARERSVRSPARRPLPSPEKKPVVSSRPAQGRAMASHRRNVGGGMGPPNGLRRDAGEGSARRSRSPVTRGQVGPRQNVRYRSPGLSENGRAGGRSPARALDNVVKVEKSSDDVVLPENNNTERRNDDVSGEAGESLENPLVSLECFIFL